MIKRIGRLVLGLALGMNLTACADAEGGAASFEPSFSSMGTPELVECPSSVSYETSELILPTGGSVDLRGHSVSFGLGALLLPLNIELREPASRYMMIDLRAGGYDHFQFQAPVTVTISYARCTRANIDGGPLSVWHVDPVTGELLENMGGVDDKVARTVTFQTDHFSGYAIAN